MEQTDSTQIPRPSNSSLEQEPKDIRRRTTSTSPPRHDSPGLPNEEVTQQAKLSVLGKQAESKDLKAALTPNIHPYLTQPDLLVLDNLFHDVHNGIRGKDIPAEEKPAPEIIEAMADDSSVTYSHDAESIAQLKALNNPDDAAFQPTVFTTWDEKDIPDPVNRYLVRPYARIAMRIVRHPTDVVFLTHLLLYLTVNLGSAIYLFNHFTYLHGVGHAVYTLWCAGSFTLMMHNHIHNNGVLGKQWRWLDMTFPYVLEPLMGHTWDSYYYHHVKHHHVEGNGTSDGVRNCYDRYH